MTKKERIELGAYSLVYCYKQGHEVMNLPMVLDMWKIYGVNAHMIREEMKNEN